jgi:hypothetical protein
MNVGNKIAESDTMSKVRVGAFSISLDGFGAGPRQDPNNPLGIRAALVVSRYTGLQKMHGQSGGSQGIDNDFAVQSFENVGAWILGRAACAALFRQIVLPNQF